jgi:hypothetical protein
MQATKYLVIVFLVSLTATLAKNEVVKRGGKVVKVCERLVKIKGANKLRETCPHCCLRIGRPIRGEPKEIGRRAAFKLAVPNESKKCDCPANKDDIKEYKLAKKKLERVARPKALSYRLIGGPL